MDKSAKRMEWESRLNDWKESGLSKAKWCRENGYKEHQMYYWIERIYKSNSEATQNEEQTKFLPITLTDKFDEPKGSVFIHVNHVSVEVKPDADILLLSKVLKVLQQ